MIGSSLISEAFSVLGYVRQVQGYASPFLLPATINDAGIALFGNTKVIACVGIGLMAAGGLQCALTAVSDRHEGRDLREREQTARVALRCLEGLGLATTIAMASGAAYHARGLLVLGTLSEHYLITKLPICLGAMLALAGTIFALGKVVQMVNDRLNPLPANLSLPAGVTVNNRHPITEEFGQAVLLLTAISQLGVAILQTQTSAKIVCAGVSAVAALNLLVLARRKWTTVVSAPIELTQPVTIRSASYGRMQFTVHVLQDTGHPSSERKKDNCVICQESLDDPNKATTEMCSNGHHLHRDCATETLAGSVHSETPVEFEGHIFRRVDWSFVGKTAKDLQLEGTVSSDKGLEKSITWRMYLCAENMPRCPECRDTTLPRMLISARLLRTDEDKLPINPFEIVPQEIIVPEGSVNVVTRIELDLMKASRQQG